MKYCKLIQENKVDFTYTDVEEYVRNTVRFEKIAEQYLCYDKC